MSFAVCCFFLACTLLKVRAACKSAQRNGTQRWNLLWKGTLKEGLFCDDPQLPLEFVRKLYFQCISVRAGWQAQLGLHSSKGFDSDCMESNRKEDFSEASAVHKGEFCVPSPQASKQHIGMSTDKQMHLLRMFPPSTSLFILSIPVCHTGRS